MTNETTMDAVRDVCAGITKRIDRAYIFECGRKKETPEKLWRLMADTGLLAIGIQEAYGGSGGGVSEVTLALDLLGQAGLIHPRIVTSQMARTTIERHANEEQKQRYLPPCARGEEYFAFAVTEAGAGTNSFNIRTRAERQENGDYILNGDKAFITGIHEADHCLVIARTSRLDPAARKSGMSVFIVDPKSKGIQITPMDIGVYMPDKSNLVFFDNVHVPKENLIGIEGQGLESLFDCLNPERLMQAGINVGVADYVLNKAVAYAKERAPFGAPIGSYQGVQHPMAMAKTRIEGARIMTYQVARQYDEGVKGINVHVSMLKMLGCEAIKDAAEIAMSTFGGSSLDLSQDLIPFYLWAKFQEIAPLNKNVVLSSIAEHGLGLPRSY